jgi:hypothetical protein
MKRCPQCEFIYEDDQSLCDMDGILLVLDSRTLPNHHALATVPGVPSKAQQRRNRPVFASLVLALVLGMVYYVSTRRSAPEPVSATTISTPATPITEPAPAVTEPTPEPQTAPAVVPEAKPAATQSPAKKSSTKTTSTAQPKPTPQAKKEENKVGSILKKTGRILKKPFKF